MKLVLYDLDGTLLTSRGVGREALERAFEERYGWEQATAHVSFAGITDPLCLDQVFTANGRTTAEARAEQATFFACYVQHLEALLAEQPDAVWALPGAPELVTATAARPAECAVGVLTGNIEAGARLKLRTAGFDDGAFRVGAFGDEAPTRNDLLPVAVARWNARSDPPIAPDQVVIVGDTPRDVAVARAHGARVVAVATGACPADQLRAHAPDVLLDDLTDLERSLAAILG